MHVKTYHLPSPSGEETHKEFHFSRSSRDRYAFDDSLFSKDGHIISADYQAVLTLTERINTIREQTGSPQMKISSAELYALGLMHEIFHHIIDQYGGTMDDRLIEQVNLYLKEEIRSPLLDTTFESFVDGFPPHQVYHGEISAKNFLDNVPAAEENSLEEMILLWVTNRNPAILKYRELVDDTSLSLTTEYEKLIKTVYLFMEKLPALDGSSLNLIDFLRLPAQHSPDSIL